MVISGYDTYVEKEITMYGHPHIAAEMHRYRLEDMLRTADKARLIASLPRKPRSFRLGHYRLTLVKEVTPHVPRLV
jgi:hypothetical protein